MSIDLLRTALAVMDHGSFAKAARELNRTEGAVSKQIKQLEGLLGVELFDRRSKPPAATATALDLAAAMNEVVQGWAKLRHLSRHLAGHMEGDIRLGVIPTVSEGILAPALARLRARYPKLQLRIESGLSGALIEKLQHARLDAAIVTGPEQLPVALTGTVLANEPIVLIAPRSLSGDAATLLASEPIIRFNRAAGVGTMIDKLLADMVPGKSTLIELDSIEAIIRMVRHGLGVALVPVPTASGLEDGALQDDAATQAQALRVIPLRRKDAFRRLVIVRSKRLEGDRLVDAVEAAFKETLALKSEGSAVA